MTMQPKEPTFTTFQNPLGRYFAVTRPAFLSASLMSCLIGLATASHGNIIVFPLLAAFTLMFGLMAHAGVNVLNDYYNVLNGTDEYNEERVFPFTGGSLAIKHQGCKTIVQFCLVSTAFEWRDKVDYCRDVVA